MRNHHNNPTSPRLPTAVADGTHRPYESHKSHCAKAPDSTRRAHAGSTLTEVLVALMIMSIGLVSVAVMFPLSVLRSVKASQYTNATMARYNAEAMIDLYPNLVHNPSLSREINTGVLRPQTWYGQSFIVDPLGYSIIYQTDPTITFQYYGNDSSLATPSANPMTPVPNSWTLPRFTVTPALDGRGNAIFPTASAADGVVTLPDSWILQYEGIGSNPQPPSPAAATQLDVTGLGATGFTLPTLPAGAYAGTTPPTTRAVIFSGDGLTCQTRTLIQPPPTGSTSDTIAWASTNPLPTSFTGNASGIGKVRIEMEDRRYTWLLTVRVDGAGVASVDVVVFFNRPFDSITIDEALYLANFVQGSYSVQVTYPQGAAPQMKRGSFIFDANNCFWYRISNVVDNGTGTSSTIYLDVPANASNSSGPPPPRAMFPRNIVDVYPIGTK